MSAALVGVGAGAQVLGGINSLRAAGETRRAAKARAEATTEEIRAFQQQSVAQEAALSLNAALLDLQADKINQEADRQSDDIRLLSEQVRGQVLTSAASSGVRVDSGSVLDVLADNEETIELQAQEALRAGEAQASAVESRARGARQEALGINAARPGQVQAILRGGRAEARTISRQADAIGLQGFTQIAGGVTRGVLGFSNFGSNKPQSAANHPSLFRR